MHATRKVETCPGPAKPDVRGGGRPPATRRTGRVLRIVSTDPRSVDDFRELMKTATKYELLRHERGRDDWGRRTYTHVLRRKA